MTIENWKFDTVHSSLNFWVRHLMVAKVHGRFTQWTGSLAFDAEAPERSRVEVQIDAASVDTREPQRDAHLKSPDFFDVDKYPAMAFKSRRVERAGDDSNHYRVVGDLTLHGVTREIALEATLEGQTTAHYLAERLERFPVRLTQLAHGLPVGGELDYLDEGTLAQALRARRPVA